LGANDVLVWVVFIGIDPDPDSSDGRVLKCRKRRKLWSAEVVVEFLEIGTTAEKPIHLIRGNDNLRGECELESVQLPSDRSKEG